MPDDFTSLNNPQFLYLAELHCPFPDWVANQPMPEKGDFEKKASQAFADPVRRLLPISTKAAAFHSAINIFACMEDFPAEAFERVKEACAHFAIEEDVAPYALLFAGEVEKSASLDVPADGRYAIDTELGGEHFQLLPVNDADDVLHSAYELAKMASERRIHHLMFVPAAQTIVKEATDIHLSGLPDLVIRYGSPRFDDFEKAQALIDGREKYAKADTEIIGALYAETMDEWDKDTITAEEAMEKIAAIDSQAGIDPNYRVNAHVPTPFDIVFSGPYEAEAEKVAMENVYVNDVLLPLAAVQSLDPVEVTFKLSKSAAEEFGKLRDGDDARDLSLAVESWPDNDRRTLLRLTAQAA